MDDPDWQSVVRRFRNDPSAVEAAELAKSRLDLNEYATASLDSLRQHDADEALAILEWPVADALAKHDRARRQLQRYRQGAAFSSPGSD